MATKAEVRQRVGEDLGLVPIGQDLESQDQARIDATYDEMYARLKEKGLAAWASDGEVPDRIVPYFCLLMEEKLLTSYSVPENRNIRIRTDAGEDGEKALLKLSQLTIQEYESIDDNTDF
jgi:hypothetical protein